MAGLVVDLFAGGGGASLGIEWALGRSPDIAIDHDAEALTMHKANHPRTRHLCGDVWRYVPRDVTGGCAVELLHASPACTYFSKAKTGPFDRRTAVRTRALAWVVTRWARDVHPRLITLENVPAFEDWGPLDNDGRPHPDKTGTTFRRFVRSLEREGYAVEWRNLRACDYGAPTTRERLFLVARLDGRPEWPASTHGPGLLPYRSAAECIDWSIPRPSIFGRSLSDATLRRIESGLRKFVIEAADPFVVDSSVPWLIHQGNGERLGQAPRIYDLQLPLSTVVASGIKHVLVRAFVAKHYGGHGTPGADLRAPLSTITTIDHHALVTSHGEPIVDVGMRSLVPRELFRAQGFPDSWVIDPVIGEKPMTKTAKVRIVGNSVSPQVEAALVAANVIDAPEGAGEPRDGARVQCHVGRRRRGSATGARRG